MTIDEAIKKEEELAIQQIEKANALDNIPLFGMSKDDIEEIKECYKCSKEHEQFAEWLKELKLLREDRKTGEWQRMSDYPEDEDSRYRCSCCGNVVHFSSKVNLYTFSRWCGKCGSDNGRR